MSKAILTDCRFCHHLTLSFRVTDAWLANRFLVHRISKLRTVCISTTSWPQGFYKSSQQVVLLISTKTHHSFKLHVFSSRYQIALKQKFKYEYLFGEIVWQQQEEAKWKSKTEQSSFRSRAFASALCPLASEFDLSTQFSALHVMSLLCYLEIDGRIQFWKQLSGEKLPGSQLPLWVLCHGVLRVLRAIEGACRWNARLCQRVHALEMSFFREDSVDWRRGEGELHR